MTRMAATDDGRPPRQTDTSGHAARSLVTEWKWPITLGFLTCMVIASVLYVLDKPLAGFVEQVQGLLTGGALLGIALGLVRLFVAIRQMAGAERNSGAAKDRAGTAVERVAGVEVKVDALRADLVPLIELARRAEPERGGGRRREDTTPIDLG